ncbi:hypothetical protein ASE07_22570 [Noviherbaspirillum sp. Root189]|nr:hypothetical protein ASE07_22570 [Noviherbaspirillum sp. Root189]
MSLQPRVFKTLSTFIQNFAPSVSSILSRKCQHFACRHVTCVHGNDLAVKGGKAPFMRTDQLRAERSLAVTRDGDAQRAFSCGAMSSTPALRAARCARGKNAMKNPRATHGNSSSTRTRTLIL